MKRIKKIFHKHKLYSDKFPKEGKLVVSGYGYTEYEIYFCISCGDLIWKKTKDFNNNL